MGPDGSRPAAALRALANEIHERIAGYWQRIHATQDKIVQAHRAKRWDAVPRLERKLERLQDACERVEAELEAFEDAALEADGSDWGQDEDDYVASEEDEDDPYGLNPCALPLIDIL